MNAKFKIAGIKVQAVSMGVDVEVGEISYEIENLSIIDQVQLMKTMPTVMREMKEIMKEDEPSCSCHAGFMVPMTFPFEGSDESVDVPQPNSIFQSIFGRKKKDEDVSADSEEQDEDEEMSSEDEINDGDDDFDMDDVDEVKSVDEEEPVSKPKENTTKTKRRN